jgi:hypothetical protein
MDPDLGGPKTYGSHGSATLLSAQRSFTWGTGVAAQEECCVGGQAQQMCHIREHLHQIKYILDPTGELTTLGKSLKSAPQDFQYIFVNRNPTSFQDK